MTLDETDAPGRRTNDVAVPGCCELLLYFVVGSTLILGNLLSYIVDAGWSILWYQWYLSVTCLTLLLLPFLGALVFRSRDRTATTWYKQYCNTPGQRLAMIVFYACFWGFVGHVMQLIVNDDCDVCTGLIGKTWPKLSNVAQYFPALFWVHATTSGVIALLAPLQFTEKIRKWNEFRAHRWIGRLVLLASCVHQIGATYLTISNLFFNRHNAFPTSWAANTVYALGFVPFNIFAWMATIQGWRCARQRRINEHGAWMYRLGGMWIIFVIFFRVIDPPLEMLDEEWGLALHMPTMFLWMIPLEIYIQKSGRFDWQADSRIAGTRDTICPCPFSWGNY